MGAFPCSEIRMHRTSLLFCVFMFVAIAVARNPKDKYGILYVNEITANIDTFTVKIEDSFVEDNILRIDLIEEWSGDGVRSEGIFFNDGDVVLADFFYVNPNTTFPGELYANGGIFIGSIENGNVRIKRPDANGDGGRTTYQGQDSPNGDGGDLLFAPGDSTAGGNGGDLIIVPGLSPNGNHGHIYFGSDEPGLENDIAIQRPLALTGNGGDTIFAGQSSQNGDAGNLNILAGQGAIGGSLSLIPGDANQDSGILEEQGDIILGNPDSHELRIIRSESNTFGGDTIWEAQHSANSDGGHFIIKAGDSKGNGNGGSIHLQPGSNPGDRESAGVLAGDIILGDLVDDLLVTREPRNGGGLDTYIYGQSGAATQGGDLFLNGGQGTTLGGNVIVRGGSVNVPAPLPNSNAFDVGGGVFLASGNGQISGGNINIYGGSGATGGGAISINTDSTVASGSIFLNGGSGNTLGDIAIGDQSRTFILDTTPLVIQDSYLTITERSEQIFIRADPQEILTYNGKTLLRSVSDYLVPAVDTTPINDLAD